MQASILWFSSVVVTCINPHRLGLTRALKSTLAVEIHRPSIGNQHMLMESLVARHEPAHEFRADAPTLVVRQHEQVRIINDQVTV